MAKAFNRLKLLFLGIILGTCFIQSSIAQRSIDPVIQKQIDDFITDCYLPNSGVSKLGLAIVKDNGEILYTTGFGLADRDKGIPNGNQTQFLIGSVSKSFTSTIVIKVLSELFPELGDAVLDTPIRKLIPSANFTMIDRYRSEHATFRDLLSHRMCIIRDDFQMSTEPFSTASEILYRERYAKQICEFRTSTQYNNQMYVMAGELIGILANKTYPELMDSLLADIGMLNSSLVSKSDDFSNMPFRAQPYYVMNNVSHPFNTDLIKRLAISSPAGGLYATPNDMVKYMRFHLNKGNVDGNQIIPENVIAWMTMPSSLRNDMPYKSSDDDIISGISGYGLGLNLASYDGWQHIHHGGYFPPYNTLMSLYPSKNLGIFSSSNEGPGYVDAKNLHAFIFEVLRGTVNATDKVCNLVEKEKAVRLEKETESEKTLLKFREDISKEGQTSKSPKEIIGEYGNGCSGELEVSEKFNDQTNATGLYVSYGLWAKGWLEDIGDSWYRITWDTDMVHDNYALGDTEGYGYATVENETFEFFTVDDIGIRRSRGTFQLGVSLSTLPPIPWSPGSCGPETNHN